MSPARRRTLGVQAPTAWQPGRLAAGPVALLSGRGCRGVEDASIFIAELRSLVLSGRSTGQSPNCPEWGPARLARPPQAPAAPTPSESAGGPPGLSFPSPAEPGSRLQRPIWRLLPDTVLARLLRHGHHAQARRRRATRQHVQTNPNCSIGLTTQWPQQKTHQTRNPREGKDPQKPA